MSGSVLVASLIGGALTATSCAAPYSGTAYVTNCFSDAVTPVGSVTRLAVATNTPGKPIPAGTSPFGIAITPAPHA